MERYCGFLKHGLHSRKRPHANLSRRLLHLMFVEQIGLRYDLTEELAIFRPLRKAVTKTERKFPGYPRAILGTPRQQDHTPNDIERRGIAQYLVDVLDQYGVTAAKIERVLPQKMALWARVRIVDGDRIRADWKPPQNADELRDTTFIRFCKQVQRKLSSGATMFKPQLGYGRLDAILECEVPDRMWLGRYAGKTS
ncbi:hypothetical protein C8F01DRAFT_1152228, partial [Mycena amicta]